jgi:uroporphyrinogen decarboxylase
MIEGGGSDERLLARRAALEGQDWFRALMDMIIASSVDYLAAQVEAGAEAVQIFDSWAGDLAADQVPELVLDPIRRIIEGLRLKVGPVPVICFARGIGAGHLEAARVTGANALGLEQSVPVGWAAKHLTPVTAVQGNLDPLRLAIGGKALTRAVAEICASLPRHSHIFNLGHGVRQETPPDHVAELVAAVRAADGA